MRMFLVCRMLIEIQKYKIKQISSFFAHQKLSHIICYGYFLFIKSFKIKYMARKKSKLSEKSFQEIKEYIKNHNIKLSDYEIDTLFCQIAVSIMRTCEFERKAKEVCKNSKNRNAEWGFIKGCKWLENEVIQSLGKWID